MNKQILLALIMLLSINAFGMHQQKQKEQDQQQQTKQKKDKKKQRWHSNDDNNDATQEPEEEDGVIAGLKADMAAIVQNIIQKDTSVQSFIKNAQKKKRIELCPICHDPNCYLSKEVEE